MTRTLLLVICLLTSPISRADVVSELRDVSFEVRSEGSRYRYVMLDKNGVMKWQSNSYSKSGKVMSGAPLAPQEVAEDLTLAAATGTLPVSYDGSRYYIGSILADRKALLDVEESDLQLKFGVVARQKSPLRPIVEGYRKEVERLRSALSSCTQSPQSGTSSPGATR